MNKELKGVEIIILILVGILCFLIHQNLPYWAYNYDHITKNGTISSIKEEGGYINIKFQFVGEKNELREVNTFYVRKDVIINKNFDYKTKNITISYNLTYPTFMVIEELDELPSFFRTLIAPLATLFCIVILGLGRVGVINL